ncbi:MAG: PrsW family glutamic-type intramembrane protease [Dehalococcoidales bacterium]|nr:PrsW family glutamic-type intramembrane protease [Dehalococcoidales bacterium]
MQQSVSFFGSWFANPSLTGIALALVFGFIWLFPYWPPFFVRRYHLWTVLLSSALLTLAAISFIQIPLQSGIGKFLVATFSNEQLNRWLLLAGIPQILVTGLVQEGAKLAPVVIYWWYKNKEIIPGMGLAFGSIAGAGFGIFEAQWVHNFMLATGQTSGLGFLERFFVVGFHISITAIAGYGLARGKGWQNYLLAAFMHFLLNYSAVLMQKGLAIGLVAAYIGIVSVTVTLVGLWLRYRQPELEADDFDPTMLDI